jgi:DNA polymerase III subunit epsilon
MKHLGFDLESTGVDTAEDRIVTACAVLVEDGRVVFERDWLVAVDVDIPDAATAIHGITTAHAREHGVAPDVATSLTGFNVVFDLSMLNAECVRHGLGTLEEFCGRPIAPVLDGLCLDKAVDRYRPGSRKLVDVAAHYGVELTDAHNATADAVAAVEVVHRIIARSWATPNDLRALYADRRYPDSMVRSFKAIDGLDAGQMHERQIGWYAEQAAGLGEYWAKRSAELRAQAARDIPPPLEEFPDADDDERRRVLCEQADELDSRIAGLTFEWPIAPLVSS